MSRNGTVVRVIDELDGVTGVAVDSSGAVYAPELLEGAPEGNPPPGFDPSSVGRIVRIDRQGQRTYAQVTLPSGVDIEHGTLDATAWALALDPTAPPAGQLAKVSPSAFTRNG